ncbi:MAG: CDF family Co(II)/Ni(II) efflux transporter DmeF [Xanthobacteraceae bacterium]
MHTRSIENWRHDHVFLGAHHSQRERRVWLVVALTAVMMVVEIAGGMIYGSMALVADGWHMSTHAAALSIAALAYAYARRHAQNPRFAFGTGKVGELAGFASALILALVALMIGYESVTRILRPVAIDYNEALLIAALGLAVNLLSAWLLGDDDHDHGEEHGHHHHDHNHRAAYLHVLADAVTSVLAIGGLLAARSFDWPWIDPVVGIIGGVVIAVWAYGLLRSSGAALLDLVPTPDIAAVVRERLEVEGDRLADLHLWRLGPGHIAVVAAVVSARPQRPDEYKARLRGLAGISHVTVEVHCCPGHPETEGC